MTTCAEHRSIFDLCPNDEALLGLREVNPVLKQAVNTHPTSDGKCEAAVSVVKTIMLRLFEPLNLALLSTQSWKINPQRMTGRGSPAR